MPVPLGRPRGLGVFVIKNAHQWPLPRTPYSAQAVFSVAEVILGIAPAVFRVSRDLNTRYPSFVNGNRGLMLQAFCEDEAR